MASLQLLFPIAITLEGGVLMRGVRDTFLLRNVRVSTFLVFHSVIIGHPPSQLSIIIGVLPCWTVGSQGVPLISPDGSVYIRLPHPARRGSNFI